MDKVFSYPQEVIEELKQEAVQKAKSADHVWRQKGVWLVCKSCENEHAMFIGTKKMLVGIEDGKPKLVDIAR
jgi:hypothetical protein